MVEYKNFYNPFSNDNRIYTKEEIEAMPKQVFKEHEDAIDYQMTQIGIPTKEQLKNSKDVVYVEEYLRANGDVVRAHYRTKPDNSLTNNLSYKVKQETGPLNKAAIGLSNAYNEPRNLLDTEALFALSIFGLDTMPDSSEYYIMEEELTPGLNKVFGFSEKNKIKEHWCGIVFNDKSSISQKLSNSSQLKKQVADYYANNKQVTSKNKISVGFDEDKDLKLSIGHGTIMNPCLDEKGNFTGVLFDKYDFDFLYKEYKSNFIVTGANNTAHVAQAGDNLNGLFNRISKKNIFLEPLDKIRPLVKNYYILVPVKFKLK